MTIDPISNMIIQLKNGNAAGKDSVAIPFSAIKLAVAEVLKRAGFVKDVTTKGKKDKRSFEVELLLNDAGEPKIQGVQRISKQSCRVYAGVDDLRSMRRGKPGIMIISTPSGIMTSAEAIKTKVGGEVLFAIW